MTIHRGITLEHEQGWNDNVIPLIDILLDAGATIQQVKEKFGDLRVYWTPSELIRSDPTLHDFLNIRVINTVNLCAMTCEVCGKRPAKTAGWNRSWIKTLCLDHAWIAVKGPTREGLI